MINLGLIKKTNSNGLKMTSSSFVSDRENVLRMTNDFLYPSNVKIGEKEPLSKRIAL